MDAPQLIREIFANEVFPALGCTEPIACAYAAAAAAELLPAPVEALSLEVDPGTFKNGAAVTVPNSGGEKGNAIAAALGAVVARPSLKLEILGAVPPGALARARALVAGGAVRYACREEERGFFVEAVAEAGGSRVRCVVSEGHANITLLEKDGVPVAGAQGRAGEAHAYRDALRAMTLEQVVRAAIALDDAARAHVARGIAMNVAVAGQGFAMKRIGYQLREMVRTGLLGDDLFNAVKMRVASAADARMGGMPVPVMTSGGSGNQGALAILVPHLVGTARKVDPARIEESIAISHAVNAYVKCFVGELSVICGCAVAAGVATAIALVYQQAGVDMKKIAFAMDNVVGDLCGIICDGAKPGCSMKIVTGAETAMRAAFMALAGYGLSAEDGVLGTSPEETIANLGRVSLQGMLGVDPTVVAILKDKSPRSGRA